MSNPKTLQICELCGNERIVRIRHDSDWGGTNAMYLLNPETSYTKEDLVRPDEFGDIDCFYCLSCCKYSNKTETVKV